jgi:CBS domain-containing protein
VVVGVLSEIDCLKAILNSIYNDGDPDHRLVNEFMTTKLNTCTPSDSIVEVAQSMLETQQRRRPVLEDGKLVGQVSSGNVLWALMEYSRRKA